MMRPSDMEAVEIACSVETGPPPRYCLKITNVSFGLLPSIYTGTYISSGLGPVANYAANR